MAEAIPISDCRFRVLTLSGSLRSASSNTALLEAAARLAPPALSLRQYYGWGALPAFNPDQEGQAPDSVLAFRDALRSVDAVLIASPEYAHGVPGAFKNALDWVVGSGEFIHKPVAAINASGRAVHAQASLLDTLTMMNADVALTACAVIALPTNRLDAAAMLADAAIADGLRRVLAALHAHLLGKGSDGAGMA
ncbi:MAG: NAD(P)H-dependent FMN reductase [Herbaspirillum frisingense]|uniref:NAD(P)H-dependent FMN reductase n=1 Tax=Herbaspirillum frisingense TaxID=92645 RepID=A0A7V8FYG2_9BURK|nr:MAG: NAD(P)H-dependent FMN reductase [Herbaspirillum frisingense]